MQDLLKNVQQIQASDRAFAAIRADGSVVTWGSAATSTDRDSTFGKQVVTASFCCSSSSTSQVQMHEPGTP